MSLCSNCPTLNDDTTEETCQTELRRLEHNALDAVLHAFRAQGPMDLYKEVLLDHLKTALCISREDYIFKVDHIATSPALKTICDTLNPAYKEIGANWLIERQSLLPADYRQHMNRLGRDVTDIFDPTQVSNEDWQKMYKEQEAQNKVSFAKLLKLKKPKQVNDVIEDSRRNGSYNYSVPVIEALDQQLENAVSFDTFLKNRITFNKPTKEINP